MQQYSKGMLHDVYSGARGSNAGDDFHELWALRQALALLEYHTDFAAMSVEGLKADDENGDAATNWAGVDCALYYGGDTVKSARRIEIVQLKYSAADPQLSWTTSRLTKNTASTRNNSPIRRLADAYKGLLTKREGLSDGLRAHFISNQPISPLVISSLHEEGTDSEPTRTALKEASGLTASEFAEFSQVLHLEGQNESRFALRESILKVVAGWLDDEARPTVVQLLEFVRQRMRPEGANENWITRQHLLTWLGFGDRRILFPCPPKIDEVVHLITRVASTEIVTGMKNGDDHICLHGQGGCGKTTVLQEIRSLLPADSCVIIFDCYGGGTFLNADAYRHRPKDAFRQLSNDLSAKLRIPLLLTNSSNSDYPRLFKFRLEKAAEALAASSPEAFLVIVVDAADNSLTAAETLVPREPSFVTDFVKFGSLPPNTRLMVTARTGRLAELMLPTTFKLYRLYGFTRLETEEFVRRWNPQATQTWIDDFHALSSGNPRVQRYAREFGGDDPNRVLQYLRPAGKDLGDVFDKQIAEAQIKVGRKEALNRYCKALSILPRPVPIEELAWASEMSEAETLDISADLAPGVRVSEGVVGLADEDFEHHIRQRVEGQLESIRVKIATRFLERRQTNEYAALHVASALHAAGRGRDLLDLISKESEPQVIKDPVLRREARLQRLRIAMQVCSEQSDLSATLVTLLVGAEAIRGDDAIYSLVIGFPDLAAAFMRESATRLLLLDSRQIVHQGPLLFHLYAEDARSGNAIEAREKSRQLGAWLERRQEAQRQDRSSVDRWEISELDIAAQIEAVLKLRGVRAAAEELRRWSPREIALRVTRILVARMVRSGQKATLNEFLAERLVPPPWDLWILIPLALSGDSVDIRRVLRSLERVSRRRWLDLNGLREHGPDDLRTFWLDYVLSGCEMVIARGGSRNRVRKILNVFAKREYRLIDRLYPGQTTVLDATLRATSLLQRLNGRSFDSSTYLVERKPDKKTDERDERRQADREHRERIRRFVGPLLALYQQRAQLIIGERNWEDVRPELVRSLEALGPQGYEFTRIHGAIEMRRKALLAVSTLSGVPNFNNGDFFKACLEAMSQYGGAFGSDETAICEALAYDPALQEAIVATVAARADKITAVKTLAREKIDALLRLARFVMEFSKEDAQAIFARAHSMTEEIDREAVYLLRTLSALAIQGASAMDTSSRRRIAQGLHLISTDAATRLSGEEGFPWFECVGAIATLDLPAGLAGIARWQDTDIVRFDVSLPPLVGAALAQGSLAAGEATSLLKLVSFAEEALLEAIVACGIPESGPANTVIEEIAKDELYRFGPRAKTAQKLEAAKSGIDQGPWLRALTKTTEFITAQSIRSSSEDNPRPRPSDSSPEYKTIIEYATPQQLATTILGFKAESQAAGRYESGKAMFDVIKGTVPVGKRTEYLNSIVGLPPGAAANYEIADAICSALESWRDFPAVRVWCERSLADAIVTRLPGFISRIRFGGRKSVTQQLEILREAGGDPALAIIKGIGTHIDSLSAENVFELVRLIAEWCAGDANARALDSYSKRLTDRLSYVDADLIPLDEVPLQCEMALARFLYALMSDVDVRIRWRAAHATRALVRLGHARILDNMIQLFSTTIERAFRQSNAPFYFLSARLWLLMTVDRVAQEAPEAVSKQGSWLLAIAADANFPHLLIRGYAHDAVLKLERGLFVSLTPSEAEQLRAAYAGATPRRKAPRTYKQEGPSPSSREQERRFGFNSLDTVPYWYNPALSIFADVTQKEFLDTAEEWIVDEWKVVLDEWRKGKECRPQRFSESNWSLSYNDHGSMPVLERYSTYLEWHAMCCAIGQLMATRPLVQDKDDAWGTLEGKRRHWMLTAPPQWLADLRCPKPAERRFWFQIGNSDKWPMSPTNRDFLLELGPKSTSHIVVRGWHVTGCSSYRSEAHISSALVQPQTARALLRALQTAKNPHDFKIPDENDHLEIDHFPYRMLGWLEYRSSGEGTDELDPLRHTVGERSYGPGRLASGGLRRVVGRRGTVNWINADGGRVFTYEAWSDRPNHVRDDGYTSEIESEGRRLWASSPNLKEFLLSTGWNLIVEIDLARDLGYGRGYRYYDDDKDKRISQTKIFILRADGTIEGIEGRVGSW